MATKQRLTFASMWAFEEIGVSEIEEEFQKRSPQLECQCEYSNPEDVLVIKGKLDDYASDVVTIVSAFIEDQKNKDLLDMPRVRLLDIPSVIQENTLGMIRPENDGQDLLPLVDAPEEVVPHPITRVTKFWLSSDGGVGCFSGSNFSEILTEIANCTGTDIGIVEDLKCIQVSGKRSSDVDDALGKLDRIEKPMSFLKSPRMANIVVVPNENPIQLSIQSYSNMGFRALRHFPMDPNTDSHINFGQMFVTILHPFDDEAEVFTLPKHICNPSGPCNEPGDSHIWSDFTFQELGVGDKYLAMESIFENNPVHQSVCPEFSLIHPYLTAEKAKQVNQWVVERAGLEAIGTDIIKAEGENKTKTSPCNLPQPQPLQQVASVSHAGKRTPGIKARRVIMASDQTMVTPASEVGITKPEPPHLLGDPKKCLATPRKRWKMNYSAELGNPELEKPKGEEIFNLPTNQFKTLNKTRTDSNTTKPPAFDATRYGLNKAPIQTTVEIRNNSKLPIMGTDMSSFPKKGRERGNELVDVLTPTSSANNNTQPVISFNQPALVPEKSSSSETQILGQEYPKDQPAVDFDSNIYDLDGLKFDTNINKCITYSDESSQKTRSSDDNIRIAEEDRLKLLKKIYHKTLGEHSSPHKRQNDPSRVNSMLAKKEVTKLQRGLKNEGKQHADELSTRVYHRTMTQRASKSSNKAKEKATVKAKKQATLEDAWGMPKPSKTKPKGMSDIQASGPSRESTMALSGEKNQVRPQDDCMNVYIKQTFAALKPTLEAAEAFPGILTLEIQIGSVFIPLLPKTCGEGLMSPNEWSRVFQPRPGLTAPSTKFVNKLTTSGTDVDHIIDLRMSKSEGKRLIFESEYAEYGISYQYHCQTKAGQALIITIDEQGKYSIQKPSEILGAANLHFPGQVWDARAVISGQTNYRPGTNLEFEEAARYLAENIWVPPEKSLIRIFTCLPKGNKIFINKVFMKRWTRHRHIRFDGDQVSKMETGLKEARENKAKERSDNQDIFLHVTEVQDLFIGTSDSTGDQPVRARCASHSEMIRKERLWYEVSIVSPTIDAILKTNVDLEVGERIDDWESSDLLGKDAILLDEFRDCPASVSPVAAAIGAAGLGDMFRLTNTVVEKINSVGYWNNSLTSDGRMVVGGSFNNPVGGTQTKPTTSSYPELQSRVEGKDFDFDEIESVKEIESVGANIRQPPVVASVLEQYERDYW